MKALNGIATLFFEEVCDSGKVKEKRRHKKPSTKPHEPEKRLKMLQLFGNGVWCLLWQPPSEKESFPLLEVPF